jgi:hypothetical protein
MDAPETFNFAENEPEVQWANARRTVVLPMSKRAEAEQPLPGGTTQRGQQTGTAKQLSVHPLEMEPSGNFQQKWSTQRSHVPGKGQHVVPTAEERFWLLNRWQGQVLMNRWQGQVLTVGSDSFEAQLFDPGQLAVIEYAEFAKSELPPDALMLLRPGAMFYWMIGYRDRGSRQRTRESVIWMRRTGRMDAAAFDAALGHVEDIWRAIESPQSNYSAG